ncbi:MAG: Serine/threonine-protein kinase AfsK [candidate division BRC1 bacterium ADurb.BinA364]|nr:MAG: Serine/threonine-protein kinase AfsK [candidate division BRC1 bacterium ADurb.BinA364]
MMPANGLQYAPPHPCQCYIDEKLNGMNALAPEPRPGAPVQPERIGVRETGPAFGMAAGQAAGAEDWAVFRADSMRTASIATALPAQPELLWRKEIGSGIAAPISVGDRVFAPVADRHSVVALNAADGGELWEFHAGARVDSPPAFHNGTLIFGSADGWVYCLRAEDGALVWRFRAAPAERRIGAFDQIESAWPVHGSVLVMDGVVYCAAGRSSHLDGGLRLYAIDASTGKMLRQATLEGPDYDVETMGDQNYGLPMGSIPDILLGDGSRIFMREQIFDAQLKEQPKAAGKAANVLQAKGGLLDDSYFKRAPWTLGSTIPYANLIALDSAAAYAVQMFDTLQGLDPSVYFVPGGKGYLLYSKDIASGRKEWEWRVPVRVTAMAAAGDRLFAAGVPDMIAADDPLGAFEGRLGAFLFAVDKKSGEKTWETRLQAAPAFDGLIAANRRLFIATQDGALSCYGDRTGRQK